MALRTRSANQPEIPEDIVNRCFSRMAAWVKLSICVVKQEYPDYELVSCFGVLSLSIEHTAGCWSLTDDQARSLARLAKAFELDFGQLADEVRLLSPLAARIFAREHVTNQEAWRRATKHWRAGRSASSLVAATVTSGLIFGDPICEGLIRNGCDRKS